MAANLGKVMITTEGKYVTGIRYSEKSIVTYKGNTYISLKETAEEPADDGVNWMMLLEGVPIATSDTVGKSKPDGETITIDEDGTLHGASQVPEGVTFVDLESSGEALPEKVPVNADQLGGQSPEYYASAKVASDLKSEIYTNYPVLHEATNEEELYEILDNYSANMTRYASYKFTLNENFGSAELGGGVFEVHGFKVYDTYEFQILTQYESNIYYRTKTNGKWEKFKKFVFKDELSGYLSTTGGKISGLLRTRHISGLLVSDSDNEKLQDLYLNYFFPQSHVYIYSEGTNGKALHTGNCNRPIISASAPTDTTALWYNPSTKAVKSYIDGAWT